VEAFKLVKRNAGSAGVGQQSLEDFEKKRLFPFSIGVREKAAFIVRFKTLAKVVDKAEYFFERNHVNLLFSLNFTKILWFLS
jgi:hypothetical protein